MIFGLQEMTMKNFLRDLEYKAARFMYGRYGADELSRACLIAAGLMLIASVLLKLPILNLIGLVLLIWTEFRMYSKNIAKRRAERQAYLNLKYRTQRPFRVMKLNRTEKEYKHFACPQCGRIVRVPKGHGRITVTCRQCGKSFEGRS